MAIEDVKCQSIELDVLLYLAPSPANLTWIVWLATYLHGSLVTYRQIYMLEDDKLAIASNSWLICMGIMLLTPTTYQTFNFCLEQISKIKLRTRNCTWSSGDLWCNNWLHSFFNLTIYIVICTCMKPYIYIYIHTYTYTYTYVTFLYEQIK